MMKEKIIPYQSCPKSVFVFLGIILIFWSSIFSIILISYGAWPITIFLGIEYIVLVYLVRLYFKDKDIEENISISINEVRIDKLKNNKIFKTVSFKTYWSRINFYKYKNKSSLTIKQSSKEVELGSFLHTDLKEALYFKLKKYFQ